MIEMSSLGNLVVFSFVSSKRFLLFTVSIIRY